MPFLLLIALSALSLVVQKPCCSSDHLCCPSLNLLPPHTFETGGSTTHGIEDMSTSKFIHGNNDFPSFIISILFLETPNVLFAPPPLFSLNPHLNIVLIFSELFMEDLI